MKKMIALLTALVLLTMALASLAFATEENNELVEEEVFLLGGYVKEIGDGWIILFGDGMEYQINMDADTILEGAEELAVGDWAQVIHNGQMTRSIPAQVYGQVIRSYSISGVVSNLAEGSFTLTDADGSEVVVNYDSEKFVGVQDTMQVTVWFDGMMTRSIPAQITAAHIRTQMLNGVVSEVTEEGFLMVDEFGMETMVFVTENTLCFTGIEAGAAVSVTTDGTATMSIPARVVAIEILPGAPVEAVEEAAAE